MGDINTELKTEVKAAETEVKKSKLFLINLYDVVKGFVVSILTAGMTTLYSVLNTGAVPDQGTLKAAGISGAAAGIGYVIKNFLTNSKDELLKPEPK